MISFNILGNYGRLGNSMFQYASLRGIASHRQFEYCIPSVESTQIDEAFSLENARREITNYSTIHERMFSFDQDLFDNCPDNVNLHGFFQTEKYFKHIENEIRQDFQFRESISCRCSEIIQSIKDTPKIDMSDVVSDQIIAIHIRRGDYLNIQDYHPVMPIEYYTNALAKLPYTHVLVLSEDVEWCQQQPQFNGSRFFFSKGNSPAVDLCLMSMCDYHVIANSTFSWWGAWLARSKQVIAPATWFGPAYDKDTSDVYCDGWIKL